MSSYTIAITPAVPTSDHDVQQLDAAIQRFNAHTPMQFLHFDQRVSPTSTYDYTIKALDGRTFSQVYDYADPVVPALELPSVSTGGSKWSLVEINLHRDIRSVLLLVVAQHGVTSLRATFA